MQTLVSCSHLSKLFADPNMYLVHMYVRGLPFDGWWHWGYIRSFRYRNGFFNSNIYRFHGQQFCLSAILNLSSPQNLICHNWFPLTWFCVFFLSFLFCKIMVLYNIVSSLSEIYNKPNILHIISILIYISRCVIVVTIFCILYRHQIQLIFAYLQGNTS